MGGVVSRRKAYDAPKIGFGAMSRQSPEKQQCAGCAGARATARQIRQPHGPIMSIKVECTRPRKVYIAVPAAARLKLPPAL